MGTERRHVYPKEKKRSTYCPRTFPRNIFPGDTTSTTKAVAADYLSTSRQPHTANQTISHAP